jgi:hypothetical protein
MNHGIGGFRLRRHARTAIHGVLASVGLAGLALTAQAAQPSGPPPPQTPKAGAPIDLTGYWVSIVNEEWRWRMVTPPKGDYASVPLNPNGRRVADTWDTSQDGSCKAYGAGGLMRMPTRVHITWEGEDLLKIETDAGKQTRRLVFGKPAPAGTASSLQGYSMAQWNRTLVPLGLMGFNFGPPRPNPPGGSLQVVTTNLTDGWLRKNGVPYSANAKVTEYFDRFPSTNGDEWFMVTTVVEDPQYLFEPFVTSSHFKREKDGAKWDPAACK